MDELKRAKQMAFHQSQATSSETITYLVNVDIYVLLCYYELHQCTPYYFMLCIRGLQLGACNWGLLKTSSARHLVHYYILRDMHM